MFYSIASDAFPVSKLVQAARQLLTKGKIELEEEKQATAATPAEKNEEFHNEYYSAAQVQGKPGSLLVNDSPADVKYAFAKCCNPIPGDSVIGFLSRHGDIKVHRQNCPNALQLIKTDSERIVKIDWPKQGDAHFISAIRVTGEDRVGMINDLTTAISKSLNTNMKSINVGSDTGVFEGTLILYVSDIKHLDKVIKRIQRVEGVREAYRYE